jgi:hypothetical protein
MERITVIPCVNSKQSKNHILVLDESKKSIVILTTIKKNKRL